MTSLNVLLIFIPATIAFLFGMGITPFLTHFLYKYKMWKPKAGKLGLDGMPATIRNQLHANKDVGTPRFGGVIVWASVLLTAGLLQVLWIIYPDAFETLAFVSRNQTWVPFAALIIGSLVGFVDDLYEVRGRPGIPLRVRLLFIAAISLLCAYWFY